MDFMPAIFKTSKVKQLANIKRDSKEIAKHSQAIARALPVLRQTSARIDHVLETINNSSFEKPKEFIRGLKLDEEYKESLVAEIDNIKVKAIQTLKPLRDNVEKLQANTMASIVSSQVMGQILQCQHATVEVGIQQNESIKEMKKVGYANAQEIEQLLREVEEINNVAKSAVMDFKLGEEKTEMLLSNISNGETEDWSKILG